ncbi:hypothetical protein SAMN04489841_1647 [Natrinema salaciae]|uniref:Uncharacterized protein n=1 Tax=Natrinema salaciae TaxID=1186196 RepID=A0A1H9FQD6_9EURY|nr:hypothetical protein SAMN04489841_1647 [Natrinema salaciae]
MSVFGDTCERRYNVLEHDDVHVRYSEDHQN